MDKLKLIVVYDLEPSAKVPSLCVEEISYLLDGSKPVFV